MHGYALPHLKFQYKYTTQCTDLKIPTKIGDSTCHNGRMLKQQKKLKNKSKNKPRMVVFIKKRKAY